MVANAFFPYKNYEFMLNTMMEKENKRFSNISIPFLRLFMMKLIAQINILFFPKLKVLV